MNKEEHEKALRERQRKHLESLATPASPVQWKPCLHDACERCHGTCISHMGPCIHSLVCTCPKCSTFATRSLVNHV